MVFDSVRKFVYDRRRTIISGVAFVGGAYLAGHYAFKRLEEVKERMLDDRVAKENLRNRFLRNQEDCIFTSQALVEPFGKDVLEDLDVEALTLEIQQYGKGGRTSQRLSMQSSAFDASEAQIAADATQAAQQRAAANAKEETSYGHVSQMPSEVTSSDASHSWVAEFTASQTAAQGVPPENRPLPPATPSEGNSPKSQSTGLLVSEHAGSVSEHGDMADSVYTQSSAGPDIQGMIDLSSSAPTQFPLQHSIPPPPPKTKAELWKELRTMTFTRTLTLIYTLTLLTLQTHIQLNLLASFKYVQSIVEMEREQKAQELWAGFIPAEIDSNLSSLKNLFFGASGPAGGLEADLGASSESDTYLPISETTEQKYLTMNWWLLKVGWKDLSDRIQSAVHEVFDGLPLKSELSIDELRGHIQEVRRRVALGRRREGRTAESSEELTEAERLQLQGIGLPDSPVSLEEREHLDFLPIMLPLTWATEQQTLLSGGLNPDSVLSHPSSQDNRAFRGLMDQTKKLVHSRDFEVVLQKSLDMGTDIFMAAMHDELFGGVQPAPPEGEEPHEPRIRLASVLPGVARWSHTLVHGMPNELIESISHLPATSAFSAVIFASYEERLRR